MIFPAKTPEKSSENACERILAHMQRFQTFGGVLSDVLQSHSANSKQRCSSHADHYQKHQLSKSLTIGHTTYISQMKDFYVFRTHHATSHAMTEVRSRITWIRLSMTENMRETKTSVSELMKHLAGLQRTSGLLGRYQALIQVRRGDPKFSETC